MIFHLFLAISFLILLGGLAVFLVDFLKGRIDDIVDMIPYAAVPGMVAFMVAIPCIVTWYSHAGDLAVLQDQHLIIAVQEERVKRLSTLLQTFDHSNMQPALLNADHPIASVIKSLSEVEAALANAKVKHAQATMSITARSKGPFSGALWWAKHHSTSVDSNPE